MKTWDRDAWGLDPGILMELSQGPGRIAFWSPLKGKVQGPEWERIGTGAGAEVIVEGSLRAIPASAVPARRLRTLELVRRWVHRLGPDDGERTWLLPNGDRATQAGPRENGLLLVWADGTDEALDEQRVRARWPLGRIVERLGSNLVLVRGIDPARSAEATPPETDDSPQAAERAVANARRTNDPRVLAASLADLGAVLFRSKDPGGASAAFEESLGLARQLGDRAGECDVLCGLGSASLQLGDPAKAHEQYGRALELARESGDPFAEKLALERLGQAYLMGRAPEPALDALGRAIALAQSLGDGKHEAQLRWYLGIALAELGRRDQAIEQAGAAVVQLERLGSPEATCFVEHLRRYREFNAPGLPDAASVRAETIGPPAPAAAPGQTSPARPLRQALSAVNALTKFLASGGRKVTASTREQRLQTCRACEHHTGLRCRLCGCFTQAKTWLPHERCPLAKWTEERPASNRS
jgi:tetratricopeptide (TPR) repeat protein